MELDATLKDLGLKEEEIQVYSTIIQFGYRTLGQIQVYYDQSSDVIMGALKSLIERGYIKEIKAENQQATPYYIPLPPQIKLTEDVSLRLKNELRKTSDGVLDEWKRTIDTLSSNLNNLNNAIITNSDKHASEVKKHTKSYLDNISSTIDENKQRITEIKNKLLEESSSLLSTNIETFNKSIQRMDENTTKSFDTTITKIGAFHENFKTKIESTYTEIEEKHKERVHSELSDIKQKIDEIQTKIQTLQEEYNTLFNEKKDLIQENTNDTFNELKLDSERVGKEAKTLAQQTINTTVENYKQQIKQYQQNVKEILSSLNDELKNLEIQTTTRIESSIEKSKNIAVERLKENETNFVELVNRTKDMAVKSLGSIITDTKTKSVSMKNELTVSLSGYLEDFKTNSDNLLDMLKEGLTKGVNELEKGLNKSVTTLSNNIMELNNTLEEFITAYITNVFTDIDNLNSGIIENLNTGLESFKQASSETLQTTEKKVLDLQESFTSTLAQSIDKNKANLGKAKSDIIEKQNQSISSIEKISTSYSNAMDEKIKEKQTALFKVLLDASSSFNEMGKQNIQALAEKVEGYTSLVETELENFDNIHEDFKNNFQNNLTELKTSVISDISNNISSNSENIKQKIREKEEEYVQNYSLIIDEFLKEGRDVRDDVPNTVELSYQATMDRLNELENKMKRFLEKLNDVLSVFDSFDYTDKKVQNALKTVMEKEDAELFGDKYEILRSEYQLIERETNQKMTSILSTLMANKEAITSNVFQNMNKHLDDLTEKKDAAIQELGKVVTKSETELDQSFNHTLKSMKTHINKAYDEYSESFNQIQETHTTKMKELIGRDEEAVKESYSQLESSTNNVIEAVGSLAESEDIKTFFTELNKDGKEIINLVSKENTKLIKGEQKAVKGLLETIKTQIDTFNQSVSGNMTEVSTELSKANKSLNKKGVSLLNSAIEKATQEIDGKITQSKAKTNEMVEAKKVEIKEKVETGINSLKTEKEQILGIIKNSTQNVSASIEETIKTKIDEHSILVTDLTSSMDSTMESLENELDNAKKALDEDISVTLDKASNQFSQHTERVSQDISTLIKEQKEVFSTDSEEIMAEISIGPEKSSLLDKETEKIETELDNLIKSYPNNFEEEHKAYMSSTKENLIQYQEQIQSILNQVIEKVKKDLDGTYSTKAQNLEETKTSLDEIFEKTINDFGLNVQHQTSSLVTASDTNSSSLVTNIQGTRDTLLDATGTVKTNVTKDLKSFEKLAHEYAKEMHVTETEQLDTLVKEVTEVKKDQKTYVNSLMTHKEQFVKTSQGEVTKLETNVKKELQNIPNRIGSTLDAIDESMVLMKQVLSLGGGIEPKPVEDTWIISGEKEVTASMMGMLKDVKTKANIIAPEFSWADEKWIGTFTGRLEVYTDKDKLSPNLTEILNKPKDRGTIVVNDFPDAPVMIGIRDGGEQGFIGHRTKSGDLVLIMSVNENMVLNILTMYNEYRSRPPRRR